MSCSGSHLGNTINIKNTKFVKDLPMIDAQFRFNQSIKDCLYLIKFVLRCLYIEDDNRFLYIEDDNRFMFLTEIQNVGKPDVEIDVKYSERDRTVRYGLV
jgi:hypothetical protein